MANAATNSLCQPLHEWEFMTQKASSTAHARSSLAASLSSPGFTVTAAAVGGVAMMLNHADQSRILFAALACCFVLSHWTLTPWTAARAGILMLSLVAGIHLLLTIVVLSPQQLDESIRAITSVPLRNATVCIAIGTWLGSQQTVPYWSRLAVLVVFHIPVAIATRWAGAIRSGSYGAVDPVFMSTWLIVPLLASFYGALAIHMSSDAEVCTQQRDDRLMLENHLAWLQEQLQRRAVKTTLAAVFTYLVLVPMETGLVVRLGLPIFPFAPIF